MTLTNPPFTRDPKQPPFHLRSLTPEEMAQWERMRKAHELVHYKPTGGRRHVADTNP